MSSETYNRFLDEISNSNHVMRISMETRWFPYSETSMIEYLILFNKLAKWELPQ